MTVIAGGAGDDRRAQLGWAGRRQPAVQTDGAPCKIRPKERQKRGLCSMSPLIKQIQGRRGGRGRIKAGGRPVGDVVVDCPMRRQAGRGSRVESRDIRHAKSAITALDHARTTVKFIELLYCLTQEQPGLASSCRLVLPCLSSSPSGLPSPSGQQRAVLQST